jgi:hypothetical protein
MSTGTKIVKSGSEPPTAVELDVAQVKINYSFSFFYLENSILAIC